jgi:hypothetical protein
MAIDKAAPGGEQPSVFSPSICAASSVRAIRELRVALTCRFHLRAECAREKIVDNCN